ncbi:hypothetical protein ADU59_13985 [Pararhizobium polonicum]|uniref:HTH lysR-type domain-containing protein n=1 Tax=Pararhizobium polonicum TaxID=1612624 RepID=A0A1C7P0S4_9HYPH|nr:LysR family transcriptional regulator [Pararhizobium polonicum]OBZ94913.1 hypothetical protein ADU59_13985 [Pararhizobium polonicum]
MNIISINSNIGIRHLRAALAVGDERSFVRAAERLGVVPSALTETIRQIEELAGVALFDRKSRPVAVTDAGRDFLSSARTIVSMFDQSLNGLKEAGGLKRGRVAIGAAPSVVLGILAQTVRLFRREHPGIDLVIHDDVADRVAELVQDHTVDFGIVARGLSSPDLVQTPIARDPFGLVCHASHALAGKDGPLLLSDIAPQDVISLQGGTGIARILGACEELPDMLRRGPIECHSTISQLMLVAQNVGVALLPQLAAGVMANENIRFLPIADLRVEREISLIHLKRTVLSPAAAAFILALKAQLNRK